VKSNILKSEILALQEQLSWTVRTLQYLDTGEKIEAGYRDRSRLVPSLR